MGHVSRAAPAAGGIANAFWAKGQSAMFRTKVPFIGSAALVAVLVALGPKQTLAQWKPSKPIDFIVMAGKGGGADKAARFLARIIFIRQLVDVPVRIVNMPGRSGGDAMVALKERRGDDHAIMFTLNSFYTTPIRYPDLKIDIAQFTPIARLAEDTFVLWVNSRRAGIRTMEDFLKAARGKGKSWVMAGTGTGAEDNLLTDFLRATYQIDITYQAMKGGGAVARALAEDQVDSTVNNPSEQVGYFKDDVTRPIVSFTRGRLKAFAATPALRETGVDFQYLMQRSVVGAPGMSAPARAFYEAVFTDIYKSAEWQHYRRRNSLQGELLVGEDLRKYWLSAREQHRRWAMALEIMLPN